MCPVAAEDELEQVIALDGRLQSTDQSWHMASRASMGTGFVPRGTPGG